jgi:hypothetical protein
MGPILKLELEHQKKKNLQAIHNNQKVLLTIFREKVGKREIVVKWSLVKKPCIRERATAYFLIDQPASFGI